MKRFFALYLSFIALLAMVIPAHAEEEPMRELQQEIVVEDNGMSIIDEIIIYKQERSTDKRAERKRTIKDGETVIAVIAFEAVFRYDGTTTTVISKTITRTDTYEGWGYKQNSFTSSGGTVTLSAKLSKLLVFNNSFTMSLSCDKNGNITYA